jgi:hypothetical protein
MQRRGKGNATVKVAAVAKESKENVHINEACQPTEAKQGSAVKTPRTTRKIKQPAQKTKLACSDPIEPCVDEHQKEGKQYKQRKRTGHGREAADLETKSQPKKSLCQKVGATAVDPPDVPDAVMERPGAALHADNRPAIPLTAVLPHCAALNKYFWGNSAFNAAKKITNQQPVVQTCGRNINHFLACTVTCTQPWAPRVTRQGQTQAVWQVCLQTGLSLFRIESCPLAPMESLQSNVYTTCVFYYDRQQQELA